MSDGWLFLVFGKASPHPNFRLSKKGKLWWRVVNSRDDALRIKLEILEPGNFRWKCKKIKTEASRTFGRRKSGGTSFQVIDGDGDPKAAMITAYRKLEWMREQEEFAASAPQHQTTPLPTPKTAPLPKQIARSLGEEKALRLMREGHIKD